MHMRAGSYDTLDRIMKRLAIAPCPEAFSRLNASSARDHFIDIDKRRSRVFNIKIHFISLTSHFIVTMSAVALDPSYATAKGSSPSQMTPSAPPEDDEDDYLTMPIPDLSSTQPETFQQRRLRLKREAEDRAHPKSKAELAAEAERARHEGLATAMTDNSKGAKMMAKLGYKPGARLGAPGNVHARAEPIAMEVKEGKEGIGVLSERKRKFVAEVERREEEGKRRKETEGEYVERVRREREERRSEGVWWAGMKVLEGLDQEVEEHEGEDGGGGGCGGSERVKRREGGRRIRDVPLFYRPLVSSRRESEREDRRRQDMLQSLTRNPTYDDPEEDAHDRGGLGHEIEDDEDGEEEDEETMEYMQLPASERVEKILTELRERFHYCFWCKYRYQDSKELEEECPGLTEDEHG